ncbi:MAG TPA: exonuclease SbcCD subunit D [Candidatus Dormibacteraeota bacterium]|jgi:exonuclease SbcD|nr:exonuclease SbcCD subunit D [Candidatus Dormibacteraeota bacterium]
MRFLHTSDWHVGRTIRGRSRLDEFAAVLDEVVAIARDQAVDAVLIAGDLFDGRAANADAERLVFETLARLAAQKIAVVAIPGNHDSAARWDALGPLLKPLHVRVVPYVAPPDRGSAVEVSARAGDEAAIIACVPFVPERMFGSAAALFAGSERWAQEYAQGMGDLLEAMATAFRPHKVNMLMAHLFATDVTLGGGENPFTVTVDYAVPPARFPAIAQYVALGHVHLPQVVAASPAPARYAGSLLQLDFGEAEQRKSVTIVEVDPDTPGKAHTIELRSGRRLSDVSGTLEGLRELAPTLGDAWLRVTVRTDGPVPGIADEVRELMPNAVDVRTEFPRRDEDVVETGIVRLDPREQYLAYYRTKHGTAPSPEMLTVFAETYEAVRGGGSG